MNDNWKFLGGLGVGLVLASLLFVGRPQLQDKRMIINQARSLGMIFPEEGPLRQSPKAQAQLFEIELKPKMTAQQIAKLLKREDIILDEVAFLEQVEAQGLSGKIIAGRYRLGEGWPVQELLELLTGKKS